MSDYIDGKRLTKAELFDLECEEFHEQQVLAEYEKQINPQSLGKVLVKALVGFGLVALIVWGVVGTI